MSLFLTRYTCKNRRMDIFTTAFIAMFVIVDPLGNAAVFSGLTAKNSKQEALRIALKAVLIAVCVLLFFGFFGKDVLTHMGISQKAFKVAGGLLLFYTAFNMVMGGHEQTAPKASATSDDIAIFPMAIPLLAGPGCATALILLMDSARAQNTSVLYVVAAMVLVELTALFTLVAATQIKALFGTGALSILARIMGILLAALAMQFIMDGLGVQA